MDLKLIGRHYIVEPFKNVCVYMFMRIYMGLKQQKWIIASQFWRLKKSGLWQGHTPSETGRRTFPCLFLGSGGLLAIFDISWLVAPISTFAIMFVVIWSSYKDAGILLQYDLTSYNFPKKSFWGTDG